MSYGEYLLKSYLQVMVNRPFLENHRPPWLRGLELDFYFPCCRVGVEFQGDHHYVPTNYCQNVRKVRRYDSQKRRLCRENGVRLIAIDACDLWTARLRHKLKPLRLRKFKDDRVVTRKLDDDAKLYRKAIKAIPGSVSAYSRKKRREMQTNL